MEHYSQKRAWLNNEDVLDDSARLMERNILEPYNPSKMDLANKKPFDFFKSWEFFEQAGSFLISSKVVGRLDVIPATGATGIYLGRQIQAKQPTIVSLPMDDIERIYGFLSQFLDNPKRFIARITPFPRTYNWSGDRVAFWSKPDFDHGVVRLAVSINSKTGVPELLLNNRVPIQAAMKFPAWPGPVILLDILAVEKLKALIEYSQKIKREVSSPPPCNTPPATLSPFY